MGEGPTSFWETWEGLYGENAGARADGRSMTRKGIPGRELPIALVCVC